MHGRSPTSAPTTTLLTPFIPSFTGVRDRAAATRSRTSRPTSIGVFTNKFATDAIRGAGPARGDAPDRGDDRPARRRARHGPARAAAQELHPQGGLPGRGRGRPRLRLRRLRRARSTSCSTHVDLDAFRARAGGAARAGHATAASASPPTWRSAASRPSRVVGPERRRPAGRLLRVARSCACTRPGGVTVYTGTSPHGQGLETGVRADRRRPPRRRRPTRSRSSTATPARGPFGMGTYGSRSLAVGGESIAPRDRQGGRQGEARSPRTCSRRRPRTSSSPTASSRSRARPTRA